MLNIRSIHYMTCHEEIKLFNLIYMLIKLKINEYLFYTKSNLFNEKFNIYFQNKNILDAMISKIGVLSSSV
jgi:hypothetical protein